MATGPRYKVAFRRRRENRTDYYARRRLLSGQEARAIVRRSNKNVNGLEPLLLVHPRRLPRRVHGRKESD